MMQVELRPYFRADGVPSMRDSTLVDLYDRMLADGTIDEINYEGLVGTPAAFLQAVKQAHYFAVVRSDGQDAGLVWLNRYQPRRAHLHFCLFSCAWGEGSEEIGRKVLAKLFDIAANGVPCLDMLWGVVPAANERAATYVVRCGGSLAGPIPHYIWNAAQGRSEAGLMFCISREDVEEA